MPLHWEHQNCTHHCRWGLPGAEERENLFPGRAGHTPFDAAQGMVGLLGCDCVLTTHVESFIKHHPQFLLHRAALNHLSAQPVGVAG